MRLGVLLLVGLGLGGVRSTVHLAKSFLAHLPRPRLPRLVLHKTKAINKPPNRIRTKPIYNAPKPTYAKKKPSYHKTPPKPAYRPPPYKAPSAKPPPKPHPPAPVTVLLPRTPYSETQPYLPPPVQTSYTPPPSPASASQQARAVEEMLVGMHSLLAAYIQQASIPPSTGPPPPAGYQPSYSPPAALQPSIPATSLPAVTLLQPTQSYRSPTSLQASPKYNPPHNSQSSPLTTNFSEDSPVETFHPFTSETFHPSPSLPFMPVHPSPEFLQSLPRHLSHMRGQEADSAFSDLLPASPPFRAQKLTLAPQLTHNAVEKEEFAMKGFSPFNALLFHIAEPDNESERPTEETQPLSNTGEQHRDKDSVSIDQMIEALSAFSHADQADFESGGALAGRRRRRLRLVLVEPALAVGTFF